MQYKGWLREFKGDRHKGLCVRCDKVFDIGAMGESALKSHMKGNKHQNETGNATGTITSFFKSAATNNEEVTSDLQQWLTCFFKQTQLTFSFLRK